MNNYIEINGKIAFILFDQTFEMLPNQWGSVKSCIDPDVNALIQKKGVYKSKLELIYLKATILELLNF